MAFGPRLVGRRVVLRQPLESDIDARAELGVHEDIQRSFGAPRPTTRPMDHDEALAWYRKLGEGDAVQWAVEVDGRFLGAARLHSFDASTETARFAVGFYDPARLGQGLGTEVMRLVLRYAFESLGVSTVTLAVLEFNERAVRCYRKCGFAPVGRVESAAVVDGVAHADIIMALSAGDFCASA